MPLQKRNGPKPELLQEEREAIVDLLHLCLYADSHIALNEGDFMSDVAEMIGWETQSSFGSYEARSVSNARAVKEHPTNRSEFLAAAAARLKSTVARALAIGLCSQLFRADG